MEGFHETFVKAVLILILMMLAVNLAHLCKKLKFHYLGESAIFILFGLLCGILYVFIVSRGTNELNSAIQMSSKFFYMVLLPPIIFEGGFTLQRMAFWKNFDMIFSLAFFGGVFSTFVTSGLVWCAGKIISPVLESSGVYRGLSLGECLVFASLISSTDPVTVLALMPNGVDQRLYMLIFGESALNDAVAVILFAFFTSVADPSQRPNFDSIVLSVLASAGVFIGSFILGIACAMVYAKFTKHIRDEESAVYQLTMMIVFAYISYLAAELLGLTGIISIFATGIFMAHYAYNNLEEVTMVSVKIMLRSFSTMCEVFIFLYLGLGLVAFGSEQTTYNVPFIICCFLAIVIARAHVFIILGLKNFFNKTYKIPIQQQILIWFCGLRGAVAFALGVMFLENTSFEEDVRHLIFGTSIIVIFGTVMVFGGLTPYMLKKLKIVGEHGASDIKETAEGDGQGIGSVSGYIADDEEAARQRGDENDGEFFKLPKDDDAVSEMGQIDKVQHGILYKLFLFDKTYVKPFFSLPKRKMQFLQNEQTPREIRGAPSLAPSTYDLTPIKSVMNFAASDDPDEF